jgi:putative tryptophan/tyrosine transport system substrate-binding protein
MTESPSPLTMLLSRHTRRREFIAGLLLAASTQCAWAQQSAKPYRIAIVHASAPVADMSEAGENPYYPELFKELRRLGYVEGRNLVVERYSGEGHEERFTELSRVVVRAKPDLIVTSSSRLVLAFKAATDNIPVVASMADPVPFGIVANLSRPGGNITGVSVEAGLDIWGKRLQVLREAVPTTSKTGFLGSRQIWDLPQLGALREAARHMDISLLGPPLESLEGEEYQRVLDVMKREHVDGIIVGDQLEHVTYGRLIFELTEKARLPAVFPYREYFEIGGLMAYGPSLANVYRRLAGYVDQILKGAKPGEIPIYLASKFELLINLKAARALDLVIPPSLLTRADEVIE